MAGRTGQGSATGYLVLSITMVALCGLAAASKPVVKLQIGVKKRVENCELKSRHGDVLSMHYTGCGRMPP